MAPPDPGRFNPPALYEALDAQRQARGLTWADVGRELGIAPSTLTRTRLGGRMEVDGMLAMVRWLGRTAESFTYGYQPPTPGTSEPTNEKPISPTPSANLSRREAPPLR